MSNKQPEVKLVKVYEVPPQFRGLIKGLVQNVAWSREKAEKAAKRADELANSLWQRMKTLPGADAIDLSQAANFVFSPDGRLLFRQEAVVPMPKATLPTEEQIDASGPVWADPSPEGIVEDIKAMKAAAKKSRPIKDKAEIAPKKKKAPAKKKAASKAE